MKRARIGLHKWESLPKSTLVFFVSRRPFMLYNGASLDYLFSPRYHALDAAQFDPASPDAGRAIFSGPPVCCLHHSGA